MVNYQMQQIRTKRFMAVKQLVSLFLVISLLFYYKYDVNADEMKYITEITYENGHVMSVNVGETKSIGLKIEPEDYTEPLTIKSSNEAVLTINQNGTMTGVSAGTAIITVQYGYSLDEIYVAVLGDHPQALICEKNNVTRLTTYPYHMEAIVFPEGNLVWSSEDESIATVTADGTFTGKKAGTVRIKAKVDGYGDESADYLTVVFEETNKPYDPNDIALERVYIDESAIVVEINQTFTPNWKFEPSNHTQSIYYKSDNPEIASVDSDGKITGKAVGGAVISVGTNKDMEGGSWQFNVYVTDGQQRVFVRVPYKVVCVDIRNADHLDADIVPNENQYTITWESSDDSVGSIDSNGDILYHKNGIVKFTAKIKEIPEIHDYAVKIVGDGLENQIVASGDADGEIVNDVVELLRDNDINELQATIKDSEKAQDSLKKLEETYNTKNGIEVRSNSEVSEISENKIEIVGAGLNTQSQNSRMQLDLTPTDDSFTSHNEYTDKIAFDMALYNGKQRADMSIPVVVTLPIPEGVDKDTMVILHTADDGSVDEVISPILTEDGSSVEIILSHFSTFAFAWINNTDFISNVVTFKVENGKWEDGTTADKKITLTGNEGDILKLSENQIPAVGSKPNEGYKAGSWNVTPNTETAITEDTTYTYTYAQKDLTTPAESEKSRIIVEVEGTNGVKVSYNNEITFTGKKASFDPGNVKVYAADGSDISYKKIKIQKANKPGDTTFKIRGANIQDKILRKAFNKTKFSVTIVPYEVTLKDSVSIETNTKGNIKKVTVNGIKLRKSEYSGDAEALTFSGRFKGNWKKA